MGKGRRSKRRRGRERREGIEYDCERWRALGRGIEWLLEGRDRWECVESSGEGWKAAGWGRGRLVSGKNGGNM